MKMRAMVVEDDEVELNAINLVLQKISNEKKGEAGIEDIDVTLARSASEARWLLNEAIRTSISYDMLLLDLGLPENRGEQEQPELGLGLLKLAREKGAARIIIVVTGHTDVERYVLPAFRLRATDMITKPYVIEDLLNAILRNWKEAQEASRKDAQGIARKNDAGDKPESSSPSIQIFINYVSEDRDSVVSLYKKLTDEGFTPWMDIIDLLPGEVREFRVKKVIRDSDFVLVCLSKSSVIKRGLLWKEIQEALDTRSEKLEEDIYLIPVRLEDCKAPDLLEKFECANIYEEGGWERLTQAIREGVARRVSPDPSRYLQR